jgi:heme/copper-type cytochrome/quinol oxidase subunit 2
MPERKQTQAQTSKGEVKWWIPTIIGIMMLFIPGGVFVSPIFFILSIIMRRKNKSKESPETPSLLFQFTP